ncbi:hypothetical protein GW17_00009751 [Ensete ventricosum]|nr:hypothetical protein GW17_00009751 [Ensete ventricosum]
MTQLAQAMVDEAANMQRRLNNEPVVMPTKPPSTTEPPKPVLNSPPDKDPKKTAAAIAAEVADKLAASTHSQQIMSSVLSTFAAEEAKNAGLAASTTPSKSFSAAPPDRRIIAEKPLSISDTTATAFIPVQPIVVPTPHQPQAVLLQQNPVQSQASAPQTQYSMYPVSTQQYLQHPGGVMIGLPYTYSALPPPPPPPPQMINMGRPSPSAQQQQQMALIQQPPPPPPLTMNQPMHITQQPPKFALQQPAPPTFAKNIIILSCQLSASICQSGHGNHKAFHEVIDSLLDKIVLWQLKFHMKSSLVTEIKFIKSKQGESYKHEKVDY